MQTFRLDAEIKWSKCNQNWMRPKLQQYKGNIYAWTSIYTYIWRHWTNRRQERAVKKKTKRKQL